MFDRLISGSGGVICFGGEDWWYHNRGHIDMQLMRHLSKIYKTLYVNSIVMQKPCLAEGSRFLIRLLRKTKSILTGLQRTDAGFWAYSPVSLPIYHMSWARSLNTAILERQVQYAIQRIGLSNPIVWVACPVACDIAVDMKKSRLVYQRTDRFEEYPNVDVETIRQYDRKLKAKSDLTIFVSSTLFDSESAQCKRAIYLDHGVDFDMFVSVGDSKDKPSEMLDIKRPVVGFFGDIDNHLFDIEFMEKVTTLLPKMSFVFIGKVLADCSELMRRKNVLMLGQKPYEQIPHYGKCFDVAIMPWKQNRWIQACNPIKLKEYLALGKPVVSTPFAELRKYLNIVYEASTAKDFAWSIQKALAEDSLEKVALRREKVRVFTWDSKAQLVLDELFGKVDDLREST
jgi:glycosyltransferase involved in cell wall biosynthesis